MIASKRYAATVALSWMTACAATAPPQSQLPSNQVSAAPPQQLDIRLTRTACLGHCPQFELVVRGGVAVWNGIADVAALGSRTAHVRLDTLQRLDERVTAARFFERDGSGWIPVKPSCDAKGCTLQRFTVCSDTPHTELAIRRGEQHNEIDDARCGSFDGPVDTLRLLEDAIEAIAYEQGWVAPR